MKYLLPIIFILAGFLPVQAQVNVDTKEWHTKEVKQILSGLYKVKYAPTPYVAMEGHITLHREKMVRDGIWKVYRHGYPVQRIKYRKGTRIWIELENGNRISREEIQIKNLQRRVKELEKQLAGIE